MKPARVQVVMATYLRPDALRTAIQSVVVQDFPDWRLLVVGDACGPETAEVTREFADPRIDYVNLSARCGEQAIPNSIGLVLAERGECEYLAFLNHDDAWLPEHLTMALELLDSSEASFFLARSVELREESEGSGFVEKRRPAKGTAYEAYDLGPRAFEPCSAWVFETRLAQRVGRWRPAREIYRTPLEDWALRCLQAGADIGFGRDVSVIKFVPPRAPSTGLRYDIRRPDHAAILELRRDGRGSELRRRVEADLRDAPRARPPKRGKGARRFLSSGPLARAVFARFGLDLYSLACQLTGQERGRDLAGLSRKRLGEALPEPPRFEQLLADARSQRRSDPR